MHTLTWLIKDPTAPNTFNNFSIIIVNDMCVNHVIFNSSNQIMHKKNNLCLIIGTPPFPLMRAENQDSRVQFLFIHLALSCFRKVLLATISKENIIQFVN